MSVGGLREEKFKGQARRTSLFQLPTAKNSPADENASELTESPGGSDTSTSFSPAVAPIPIPIPVPVPIPIPVAFPAVLMLVLVLVAAGL